MVMLAATLASELDDNIIIVGNESDAIDNLAASWEAYFYDASVGGIPANPNSLTAATTAFKSALVGMSGIDMASTKIQTAVIAFWGIVSTSAATIWTTVPPCTGATPPPLLSTIKVTLDGVFYSNMQSGLNKTDALLAIANALHPINLGGICVIPTPGAPTPIL